MIYVSIDTNVYVNLLTEVLVNDNAEIDAIPSQLEDLNLLCREGVVTLLMPEVVKLELHKSNSKVEEDYKREYSKLINHIDEYSESPWSEVREVKKKVIGLIETEQDNKVSYWREEYSKLMNLFKNKYIQHVELTPDVICHVYKKKIAGLITDSQLNDALIIESIHNYFKQQKIGKDDLLLFITEDRKDFFVKGDLSGFKTLKDKFQNPDYKVYGLYNLKQLYKYINANFDIKLPEREIETKWSDFEKRYPDWDLDSEEVNKEYIAIEEDINLIINKLFEKGLQDLPKEIINIRKRVLTEIENTLVKCRNMISWDDRSELKLYRWLNNRAEISLYSSKLSDLFLSRDSLQEYLRIHEKMDEEILEGHDWKSCNECHKIFVYQVDYMNKEVGKDTKDINCPYCGTKNGEIITAGLINACSPEELMFI